MKYLLLCQSFSKCSSHALWWTVPKQECRDASVPLYIYPLLWILLSLSEPLVQCYGAVSFPHCKRPVCALIDVWWFIHQPYMISHGFYHDQATALPLCTYRLLSLKFYSFNFRSLCLFLHFIINCKEFLQHCSAIWFLVVFCFCIDLVKGGWLCWFFCAVLRPSVTCRHFVSPHFRPICHWLCFVSHLLIQCHDQIML